MPGDLKIRAAAPDDYDEIIKLFDSWAPKNWDRNSAVKYYQKFFHNRQGCIMDKVFVGIADGKIVGVTGYCPAKDDPNGIYWLNWFYIHKDLTSHGYGGRLLDRIIEILKGKDAHKLYVNTSSDLFYGPARVLYKSRKFRKVDVIKNHYEKGEDQIVYSRNLAKQCNS
jgi:GNAT superfamily N-acetyltransferase